MAPAPADEVDDLVTQFARLSVQLGRTLLSEPPPNSQLYQDIYYYICITGKSQHEIFLSYGPRPISTGCQAHWKSLLRGAPGRASSWMNGSWTLEQS